MKRKKRKVRRAVFTFVNIAVPLTFLLLLWTYATEEKARYTPDYPMEDISVYLEREALTEEEYHLLYRQTGLSRLAVDALREENRGEELLAAQERFFAEAEVSCEGNLVLFNEVLVEPQRTFASTQVGKGASALMPALEDGDILITFNSHFLGWRNGHAAIVVDAERGLTLEALMLGKDSAVLSVNSWRDCPSFAVLRLTGASKEQRAEIAEYAENVLARVPYRLTAGIWEALDLLATPELAKVEAGNAGGDETSDGDVAQAEVPGTHCAHLVWYAYDRFGYDLDSDGGLIVTPRDLYGSPLLEVVQVYGIKPK